MSSNLPVKQNNNFFHKIKNFFREIFSKGKIENNYEEKIEVQPKIKQEDKREKSFKESIKVEPNNDYITEIKREKFLDELESNPKLLYNLPIEKLEILDEEQSENFRKYYNE